MTIGGRGGYLPEEGCEGRPGGIVAQTAASHRRSRDKTVRIGSGSGSPSVVQMTMEGGTPIEENMGSRCKVAQVDS
jgi:hypothetical protein